MSWRRILYLFPMVLPRMLSPSANWMRHFILSNLCFCLTFQVPKAIKSLLLKTENQITTWKNQQLILKIMVNVPSHVHYQYLELFVVTCSCAAFRTQLAQYLKFSVISTVAEYSEGGSVNLPRSWSYLKTNLMCNSCTAWLFHRVLLDVKHSEGTTSYVYS